LKIQDTDNESGVKILSVEENSTSANAGLQKGDVITQIADKKIKNTDEAREALHENESKQNYTVKGVRNGKDMTFAIKIPKKLKTTSL
jgi:S1-C subfamily serine protease